GGHGPYHAGRPPELRPSVPAAGVPVAPSGIEPSPASPVGTFAASQCTKSRASGSRTVSAMALVSAGAPLQASGGETSPPSHVYLTGMPPPSANAQLVTCMTPMLPPLEVAPPGPQAASVRAATRSAARKA